MGTTNAKPSDRALHRSLAHIRAAIDATLATLCELDRSSVDDRGSLSVRYFDDYPHLEFNELNKPPAIGLREELHAHLRMLLKLRHGQAAAFRRRHAELVTKAVADDTQAGQTEFRARARRLLAAEEKGGQRSPPERVIKKLQLEADSVLGHSLNVFIAQPNLETTRAVLAAMGDSMLLGGSAESGMPARALHTLQTTAVARTDKLLTQYKTSPKPETLRQLAQQVQSALTLGCSSADVQEALDTVSRAASTGR